MKRKQPVSLYSQHGNLNMFSKPLEPKPKLLKIPKWQKDYMGSIRQMGLQARVQSQVFGTLQKASKVRIDLITFPRTDAPAERALLSQPGVCSSCQIR